MMKEMTTEETVLNFTRYIVSLETNPIRKAMFKLFNVYCEKNKHAENIEESFVEFVSKELGDWFEHRDTVIDCHNVTLPKLPIWQALNLDGNSISNAVRRLDESLMRANKARATIRTEYEKENMEIFARKEPTLQKIAM